MSKALGKNLSMSTYSEYIMDLSDLQMPYLLVRQALLLK